MKKMFDQETPDIVSVECRPDYVLSVRFDNDERGLLDMSPYLDFGVFQKLRDPATFNTARISFGAIAWESGADLDPAFVYKKCVKESAAHAVG